MPIDNQIKCPNCGHEFAVEKAIFQQAEQKLKLEFEQKLADKENSFLELQKQLEKEKKQLAKEKDEQEAILSEKLKAEKSKILKVAEAKVKEEYELEMTSLKEENEKRKEENKKFKQKELELLQKEKELAEKAEEQNLELERKLNDSRKKIAQDFEQKIADRELQFQKQQTSLENEKKQLLKAKEEQESKLQEQLQEEKEKLTKIAEQKVKEQFELELANLQEENSKRKEENKLLKQKELELLKKAESLQEKEEELELELERKLQESREKMAQEMRSKEQQKSELKFREYEKKLEDQKKLIDEMKRKAEQGSMQMQGEIQELALEELLQFKFPFDTIEEVAKGVKGADVIQNVRNRMQKSCGKIIYESKRTKAFNEEWLEKLKADQLSQKADLAVIVTETMPRDMQKFGLKDGVWICAFQEVESVAFVLREMLIKMSYMKSAEENKSGKMEMLYYFLTGNEFRQQIEAIVEGFSQMKEDLEKEKRAYAAQWKKREKQIDKVISNTISMYGSVRGIAGNAIAAIPSLELPEPTLELE